MIKFNLEWQERRRGVWTVTIRRPVFIGFPETLAEMHIRIMAPFIPYFVVLRDISNADNNNYRG